MLPLYCLIFNEQAQAQQFNIGPRIGAQYSYLQAENVERKADFEYSGILAYQAGAVLTFGLTPRFSLQTELNYSRKGANIRIIEPGLRNEIRFSHLEWSGMFRLHLDPDEARPVGQPDFYLMFGPNVSYWLGGKGNLSGGELVFFAPIDYSISFNDPNLTIDQLNYIEPNRLQWGFDFGVGADLKVWKEQHLLLNLRYTLTHSYLSDFADASSIRLLTFEDFTRSANRVISLSVAYTFGVDLSLLRKGKSKSDRPSKVKTKAVKTPRPRRKN